MSCVISSSVVAFSVPFDSESAKENSDLKKENVQEVIVEASNSFSWHRIPSNTTLEIRTNRQAVTHRGLVLERGATIRLQPQADFFIV